MEEFTANLQFVKDNSAISMNRLRSCIGCGLILPRYVWFMEREDEKEDERGDEVSPTETEDCPNCHFKNTDIKNYTSASFTGCIAIFRNDHSWCALWERHHNCVPGFYALDNQGEVTKELIRHLQHIQHPLPEWVERQKKTFEAELEENNN